MRQNCRGTRARGPRIRRARVPGWVNGGRTPGCPAVVGGAWRSGYPAGRLRDQSSGYPSRVARELRGAVIVITGASSGIGRAAALMLAGHGSRLVLAARARPPLDEVAQECRDLGAESIVVATDVRDETAVERLADEAVAAFARIDVWVNCAGVIAYG